MKQMISSSNVNQIKIQMSFDFTGNAINHCGISSTYIYISRIWAHKANRQIFAKERERREKKLVVVTAMFLLSLIDKKK